MFLLIARSADSCFDGICLSACLNRSHCLVSAYALQITDLEIPNGLPIIFDLKSKCVKLLDDGSGEDPLEKYNFGKAASYLFRPCLNEDGSPDEECDIRYMGDSLQGISEEEQAALDAITRRIKETVAV